MPNEGRYKGRTQTVASPVGYYYCLCHHDQVEAMTLADQMVVLNRGRIQQIGAPQSIYARPQPDGCYFLGNPPMNILPATYIGTGFQLGDQFLPCLPDVLENCH